MDSNHRSPGYEPDELPLLYPTYMRSLSSSVLIYFLIITTLLDSRLSPNRLVAPAPI